MFLKFLYCRFARKTKRVTRVEFNKRCRQKALRKKETKEKAKEKISNEIDRYFFSFTISWWCLITYKIAPTERLVLTILLFCFCPCSLPNILEEIAREDEDKQNKHLRRVIAKEEVLKIRPPRLGKYKYETKSFFTPIHFCYIFSLTSSHSDKIIFIVLKIGFRKIDCCLFQIWGSSSSSPLDRRDDWVTS